MQALDKNDSQKISPQVENIDGNIIPYTKFYIIHILRGQNLRMVKLIIGWYKIVRKVILILINFNFFYAYFEQKFL